MRRVRSLITKEFLDLARNRTVLLPVVLVTGMSLALPFGIAVGIPTFTGRGLGHDVDLVNVSAVAGVHAELSSDGRVELFLFQQFLMLFLLTPITGAMALAAHAIVGEKQARTLEPLLATPLTTFELLVAKVLGSLVPTLVISTCALGLYLLGIALTADAGVARGMLTTRTLLLVAVVAPL